MDTASSNPKFNWDSADLVGEWKAFRQHVEFMFKGPLRAKNEEERCCYLMLWVGEKGRRIFSTWDMTEAQQKVLQEYYDRFQAYVQPKSNPIFARYKLHSKIQEPGETVQQFVTALKLLVKDCEYGQAEDDIVRDRIVFGTKSAKVREKLIDIGSDLTLERAIEVARVDEVSVQQLKEMTDETEQGVHAVKKKNWRHKDSKSSAATHTCGRCGRQHGDAPCPAMGKVCRKCNAKNHFEKMCRTKKKVTNHSHKQRVNTVDDSDSSDTEYFVGTINQKDISAVNTGWYKTIEVEGVKVNFQLDTGAKCNIISHRVFKTLSRASDKKMTKSRARLTSYSGHHIKTLGTTNLTCVCKNVQHNVQFFVTEMDSTAILGVEACQRLGLIERLCSVGVDITEEYADSFKGLGCLPGEYKIKLDPSVPPVVHAPRKVPVALHDRVKEELQRMENDGVIKKQEEPTDWVNSMVIVETPKKLRICLDPRGLNKAIKREHFPMKTIEEVVQNMPGAKVFSKLDATSGYWQLKLDEESSKLCTFNTPFGRYRFLRVPFGIVSASEIFQRVMSQMVEDIEGSEAIMDDIVVWGKDQAEHDMRLKQVMDKAKACGLKFNKGKCKFRQNQISYVGHVLSGEGLKADPEKIRAVQDMKRPQSQRELMTFLGFIQYLKKFMPNMADISAPLRKLTEKDVEWKWTETEENSFNKLKKLATEAPVLRFYDPTLPLTLSVDSSSTGLGCVIMQEGQPIAYASRALTKTQQNYAQIEKETLAVVFGCEKFHQFVYGRTVEVETDHRPLQSIFNKPLHQAPARLQRFLLQLQKYDLQVTYKPGKYLYVADTLSRSYLQETKEQLVSETEINAINPKSYLPISPEKYAQFQRETAKDLELKALSSVILKGWPDNREDVSPAVRQYWSYRDELTCLDGLLFKGDKIIVPKTLQSEMLEKIHETHLGIVKCKNRARQVLFWPGMSARIEETVAACALCAEHSRANAKEPLIPMEIPERPWAKVGADLFEFNNQHYLLIVDYFSKGPEISKLDNLSAKNVISYTKSQISRNGIPDELISDNGHQFACEEFAQFVKNCAVREGLRHQTHNIQSLPPASKRASRKNCTNFQTLTGEGERPLQGTT